MTAPTNWFRFWADVFVLFKNNQFQPMAKPICHMILPCTREWKAEYVRKNHPANDNGD